MANLEGKKAPAFSLEGSDGKKHSLEDYKGKTVVLFFYPKDNTPGCTKEACGFRDLNPSFRRKTSSSSASAKTVSIRTISSLTSTNCPTSAFGSQNRGHEKIQRLRQEDDVRQGSAGNDSFDGCHRSQGRCHQTLADGQKGRGTSTRGDGVCQWINPFSRYFDMMWLRWFPSQ